MLACAAVLGSNCPAWAAGEAEFAEGLKLYGQKNYKQAQLLIRKSIDNGNQSATALLYYAHTFMALGQYELAGQVYKTVHEKYITQPEAAVAARGVAVANEKLALQPPKANAGKGAAVMAAAVNTRARLSTAGTAGANAPVGNASGLAVRIIIIPPRGKHQAVSAAGIKAVREAVSCLPPHIREQLDSLGASILVAPNLIDVWPEAANELPEDKDALTLAEQPGRIYGKEMCVYERPKVRGTLDLGAARNPRLLKHNILNMCFQLMDGDGMAFSSSPEFLKAFELDKQAVPDSMHARLAGFLKEDAWGARETCAELTGAMLGGGNEYTDDLYRYFPHSRACLKEWLRI
jgi:tetratricopeptide (TPR) repeat protein